MIKKPLAAILTALITVLCLTSCKAEVPQLLTTTAPPVSQEVTENAIDVSSFKLSYSKSDSLNPFLSETLNNHVVQNLVFESLFTIDESYEAQAQLAESYEYTDSETLIVKLRQDIRFSNGDKMRSDNIVYSFNQAKESPRWKNTLSAFSSASEKGKYAVKFKLESPNPDAHKLLTFAIAKMKPDKKGYPIGSGRYRFNEGDGLVFLQKNTKYHEEFVPHFAKIILVNITAEDSIENAVNIGNISYAFRDLSSGSKNKINCQKKPVNLNNLVYIGINSDSGITSNKYIRRAIALAVNRNTLVKSAYRGYAKPALSVFNPACALGKSTAIFTNTADSDAARQAIEQSGYGKKDLTLDILTSTSEGKAETAQLLKQQLESVGFKVTVNREKPAVYTSKVKSKSFSIYVGETKLTADMSLNGFFTRGGSTSAGIDLDSDSAKAYTGYLTGNNEIGKFILDFSQELPFVPLLYRQGMICYSHTMHGDMQGYPENYFSNIEDWYFN